MVLSGSGRLKLDDEIIEIDTMDAIRMAPKVTRALEAGDEGLELLAFGPATAATARSSGLLELARASW